MALFINIAISLLAFVLIMISLRQFSRTMAYLHLEKIKRAELEQKLKTAKEQYETAKANIRLKIAEIRT